MLGRVKTVGIVNVWVVEFEKIFIGHNQKTLWFLLFVVKAFLVLRSRRTNIECLLLVYALGSLGFLVCVCM